MPTIRNDRGVDRPRTLSHLRALRSAAGLSQIQLAGLASSTGRAVRNVERGDITGLQIGTLIRLAAALGCGPADIIPVLGPVLPGAPIRHSSAATAGDAR